MHFLLGYDVTASMGQACKSAKTSSAEVMAMMKLLGGCVSLGVVGDYDRDTVAFSQGGVAFLSHDHKPKEYDKFLRDYMEPRGGGGYPEAYKTFLHRILQKEKTEQPQVVFLFLDSFPHGYKGERLDTEGKAEYATLTKEGLATSWEDVCSQVKKANIHVITFLTSSDTDGLIECWKSLGDVVTLTSNTSEVITGAMLWVLNLLLSQKVVGTSLQWTVHGDTKEGIHPRWKLDLQEILQRATPELVLNVFNLLLDPERPRAALALVTNLILGLFWRKLICSKFRFMEERKYESKCQHVMDKFAQCKNKLSSDDAALLKTWIDESHNETARIRDMIQPHLKTLSHLSLAVEMQGTLKLDDVLLISRGGSFRELAKLIAGLELNKTDQALSLPLDLETSPKFVPWNSALTPEEVFSLLANLLSPGLLFSRNETFMVAILALKNSHLQEMAHQYLLEHKGKWIKWDVEEKEQRQLFPVFWSRNFFQLLKLTEGSDVLTPQEIKFRDHFLLCYKILSQKDAVLDVQTPFMSTELRADVTWKRLCSKEDRGCGQQRCFTLFPGNSNICGLCINAKQLRLYKSSGQEDKLDIHSLEYMDPSQLAEKSDDKTQWAQCKTCHANYSVVCPDFLRVAPKCHVCRTKEEEQKGPKGPKGRNKLPWGRHTILCIKCGGMYCNPHGSAEKAMEDALVLTKSLQLREAKEKGFLCPRCVEHPTDMITTHKVKLCELLEENPELKSLVPIPYDTLCDTAMPLWRRVYQQYQAPTTVLHQDVSNLTIGGHPIHYSELVAANLIQKLTKEDCAYVTCIMCIEETHVRDMKSACGHCSHEICKQCLETWYSQVEPGHIVSQGHCLCPFCKRVPTYRTTKRWVAGHIRNLRIKKKKKNKVPLCPWDSKYVYALCMECVCLKEALRRECVQELPTLTSFVCQECKDAKSPLTLAKDASELNLKPCPECKSMVERTGGCHHMTCVCGSHWCWVCGKDRDETGVRYTSRSIYDHMSNCGGIFPDYD